MSRIQNILDKAEREGTVRRLRPVAEPAVSAGVATVDPRIRVRHAAAGRHRSDGRRGRRRRRPSA